MKNHFTTRLSSLLWLLALPTLSFSQNKATFEDLQLDPSSYWNGISVTYGNYTTLLEDSVYVFTNRFTRNDYGFGPYDAWSGFAYSRMQDDTTAGLGNQLSAIAASGAFDSESYAVFYLMSGKDTIRLNKPAKLDSVFITNATYPFLSMRDGDSFSKKFGGETGEDPDWFLLSLTGSRDGIVTDTVDFYLADYRFADSGSDYIVSEWEKLDLSVLDTVDMIELSLSSSDVGDWGMNTPAFFCMDNLSGADFEDMEYTSGDYWNGSDALIGTYSSVFTGGPVCFTNYYCIDDHGEGLEESWSGFGYSSMQDTLTQGYGNQYSAVTGAGAGGSLQYGLCKSGGRDTLFLDQARTLTGFFLTNGTLGANSMLYGEDEAKKFGGESGNDPDWFLLTIRGLYGDICTDTIRFYLADYRFDNNEEDYIVTTWEWVDLAVLDTVDRLEFSLSSSDSAENEMNTPPFFFLDDINDQLPEQLAAIKDTTVEYTVSEVVMDLSGIFTDPDDADELIRLDVLSWGDGEIVSSAYMGGSLLTLNLTHREGFANIVIEAVSGGHVLRDTFTLGVYGHGNIETNRIGQFRIFPNPTHGMVQLVADRSDDYAVEIFDLAGHCLYREQDRKAVFEIDITDFNRGMYILKIQSDKEIECYTIHKQ